MRTGSAYWSRYNPAGGERDERHSLLRHFMRTNAAGGYKWIVTFGNMLAGCSEYLWNPFFSRLPDQNQNFHDPIPPIVLAHLLVDKGQYPWPKRWSIFKECCIPFFSLMPGRRVGNGKGILLLTISMPNGWHCLATWNPFPSVFFFRFQRWLNEKEKTFLYTVLGHLSEETAIPKAVEVEEEAKKLGGGRDEVGHLRRFLTAL